MMPVVQRDVPHGRYVKPAAPARQATHLDGSSARRHGLDARSPAVYCPGPIAHRCGFNDPERYRLVMQFALLLVLVLVLLSLIAQEGVRGAQDDMIE